MATGLFYLFIFFALDYTNRQECLHESPLGVNESDDSPLFWNSSAVEIYGLFYYVVLEIRISQGPQKLQKLGIKRKTKSQEIRGRIKKPKYSFAGARTP